MCPILWIDNIVYQPVLKMSYTCSYTNTVFHYHKRVANKGNINDHTKHDIWHLSWVSSYLYDVTAILSNGIMIEMARARKDTRYYEELV